MNFNLPEEKEVVFECPNFRTFLLCHVCAAVPFKIVSSRCLFFLGFPSECLEILCIDNGLYSRLLIFSSSSSGSCPFKQKLLLFFIKK